MNLCNDGHEEVCYEGRNCPCCIVIEEKDADISALEDDISNLRSEVSNLESQLEEKE